MINDIEEITKYASNHTEYLVKTIPDEFAFLLKSEVTISNKDAVETIDKLSSYINNLIDTEIKKKESSYIYITTLRSLRKELASKLEINIKNQAKKFFIKNITNIALFISAILLFVVLLLK